jgi:hypothetical protein
VTTTLSSTTGRSHDHPLRSTASGYRSRTEPGTPRAAIGRVPMRRGSSRRSPKPGRTAQLAEWPFAYAELARVLAGRGLHDRRRGLTPRRSERRRSTSPKRERARSKADVAGTRRMRVSGGDRADVARRSGDSPCRTAAYATGRDAQARWLFWWSSRRRNAALVPSNETSEFVPKGACRLARCTRSDCRRRAAACWRLEALIERGGVDRGAGWVCPADAWVGYYRLSSGAGRASGRSLGGGKHA